VKSTLSRYILKEIIGVFFVSLFVFIFIIMATRMMGITDLMINQKVGFSQILLILVCMLPRVLLFSLPAACLMCVLLAFLRFSSDNEIIALNSSGISLYQMLSPVFAFSFIIFLAAGFFSLYGVPWGNRSYKETFFRIIESKANISIKERIFYEPVPDVVFYVNNFSPSDNTMKDLFVVDKRDNNTPYTIIAKRGKVISGSTQMITIHFDDGSIFVVDKNFNAVRTIKFDTHDLSIDLKDLISSYASKEKEPEEMYIGELIQNLKSPSGDKSRDRLIGIRLFEMFSIPIAIFFMGVIGAPLGAHIRSRGRVKGIIISLFIFLAYYICLMSVRYFCEMGALSPALGMWVPDILLLFICIYLIYHVANDKTVTFPFKTGLKKISQEKDPAEQHTPVQKIDMPDTIEYMGSLTSDKFHRPDCRWIKKISRENLITFPSKQEAIDKGHIPCQTCKP